VDHVSGHHDENSESSKAVELRKMSKNESPGGRSGVAHLTRGRRFRGSGKIS
jgi:hypothetical protein